MFPIIALITVFSAHWAGGAEVFRTPFHLWTPGELLISAPQEIPHRLEPGKLCQIITQRNPHLRGTTCRRAGDWERDSVTALYWYWLTLNVGNRQTTEFLAARDPAVAARIRDLDDQILLYLNTRDDTIWLALFSGPRTHESALHNAPIALAWETGVQSDEELAERITRLWFDRQPLKRLSAEEKKQLDAAPHASYAEAPHLDTWIALGYGISRAHVPLTPASWTHRITTNHLSNYRIVEDSLSAWNILEDQTTLYALRTGFTWRGFLGLEIFGLYSRHPVKTDPADTIYNELDHWIFSRYEIGLSAHFVYHYPLGKHLLWQPFVFLGFHYSFFDEDIALRPGREASDFYRRRIQFLPFYKGALFGAGQRILWLNRYGLEVRSGLNNRGRSPNREPGLNTVANPTIIGGFTLDWFLSVALEYHWSWREN